MALNPQQISKDQDWINQQWGGGYGSNGQFQPGTFNFNGGYDPSSNSRNWGILGAADATGQSSADVSQVFGGQFSPEQIDAYRSQYAPQIDLARQSYLATNGGSYGDQPQQEQTGQTPGMWSTTAPSWSGGGYSGGSENPNLTAQADDISRRTQELLGQSFAGIRGNNVGNGTLGGSRGEVAMGQAGAKAADYLQGNLANLYSGAWNANENRNLSRYQGDQNAFLGNQGQMLNFYNAQRGLDQSGAALGGSLYGLGNAQDWSGLSNAGNIYSQFSGLGGSQNTSAQQGGGWQGALGGLLSGASFGKQMGWW